MLKRLSTVAAWVNVISDLFNVEFEDQSRMWMNAYALHINHLRAKHCPFYLKAQTVPRSKHLSPSL